MGMCFLQINLRTIKLIRFQGIPEPMTPRAPEPTAAIELSTSPPSVVEAPRRRKVSSGTSLSYLHSTGSLERGIGGSKADQLHYEKW